MPTIIKPRTSTVYRDQAARDKLKGAIATLAERQSVIQAADADHDAAQRAYWTAQGAVKEIQDRIDGLAEQYRQVHSMGRADVQQRVDDCQQPLREAKAPLMALGIEMERTEKAKNQAEQSIGFYRSQVRNAAEAVVRAEAPPVAEPLTPALQDAIATILAHGPTLLWMSENGMLPRDSLGDGPHRVLNLCQSWDVFAAMYRNLAWRNAAAVLETDPDASLPAVDA